MDTEIGNTEKHEITTQDVISGIESISKYDWESANYPIISYASKKSLGAEYQREGVNNIEFWKEVLNTTHFINIEDTTKYNPQEHFLFIIHTFKDTKGEEETVKAITTTPDLFVQDPGNMINYGRHGFPCENRGGGEYPTLRNFWKDFYDELPQSDMDKYPIPTRDWRKGKINQRLFRK